MAATVEFMVDDFGVLGDILVGFIGSDDIEEFESFWLHNMSTLFDGGNDDEVIFMEERFGEKSGWNGDAVVS
ncbi:unnamed protein product [Didymodactylos carnosus]|uniref:Uncharacterized protein n=1 Tax=Didymodactylos carnosus TaxID=1234261 RepID=A0A813W7Y9_9BILA|nr:unnamed protein product [Didymodactylos carnosus]CAF3637136.1 unnamed protein product [Didymodactylos carnosus]